MIEHRTILGIQFERIVTIEDYAAWIAAHGWPTVEQFERETYLNFPQIKKLWIFVNRVAEGRANVYARSPSGGVRELLGEKRPTLQRR